MTQVRTLLNELIAIPSVNPAFASPSIYQGEKQVGDFVASVAAGAGLDIDFQKVSPGRSNVIARLAPLGPIRHSVVLAPHLDTVGVQDPKQLQPRQVDGRIYGRGSCDTKGSVAAMLAALMALAKTPARPRSTAIFFVGLVDEENGQTGSRHWARHGPQADLAIVGEPTELKVITAHKGDVWIQAKTFGKAAHGARPELGRNAVLEMAAVVQLLENTYRKQLGRRVHPLLGPPTCSVGVIQGGRQPNIVPDECRVVMDRRTLPGETEKQIFQEIRTLLQKKKLKADLSNLKSNACPALETDLQNPWVKSFLKSVGQRKALGAHFFCDAAILAGGGIPSVVFGPGNIAQAHTEEEWISVQSLEGAVEILVKFLSALP